MARLGRHYQRLLEQVVAQPDAPLARLDLLSPQEWRQQAVAWNQTSLPLPSEYRLHRLVAARAAHSPEAVALVHGQRQLTYATLLARATRLAQMLRSRGVGPETRVGLCLRRTPALLESLLGVLLAGGAYVPLDPTYPAERLAFMAADAGLHLTLAERRPATAYPRGCPCCLEDLAPLLAHDHAAAPGEREAAAQDGQEALLGEVAPSNVAYLLYTSGSTGRPRRSSSPTGAPPPSWVGRTPASRPAARPRAGGHLPDLRPLGL